MPSLAKVLQHEDVQRGRGMVRMDLTPYTDIIESVRSEGGVGGELTLHDDESKRTEKRRLSIAAKQVGMKVTWRKADDGVLRFVLSEPGGPVPGGRQRTRGGTGAAAPPNGRRRQRATA
jgi:hypothetical protein